MVKRGCYTDGFVMIVGCVQCDVQMDYFTLVLRWCTMYDICRGKVCHLSRSQNSLCIPRAWCDVGRLADGLAGQVAGALVCIGCPLFLLWSRCSFITCPMVGHCCSIVSFQ